MPFFANLLRFIQTSRPWLLVAMLVGGGLAFEAMAQVQLQLTPFGRNQRQEGTPVWKVLDARGDRVYFDQPLDSIARYVARLIPGLTAGLEQQLNVQPEDPYQVILYQGPNDLFQSNLNREKYYYNTGWNFPAPGNKVPVYVSCSTEEMVEQIREGIVRVLVAEILYGGNSWQRIQNQALLVLPSWFTDGYARYRGAGWKGAMDRELRAWLVQRPRAGFGELVRSRPDLAGVLFWHRYAQVNGLGGTARLLGMARSHRQVQSAFRSLNTVTYGTFVRSLLVDCRKENRGGFGVFGLRQRCPFTGRQNLWPAGSSPVGRPRSSLGLWGVPPGSHFHLHLRSKHQGDIAIVPKLALWASGGRGLSQNGLAPRRQSVGGGHGRAPRPSVDGV
jgi:hypothetical protein